MGHPMEIFRWDNLDQLYKYNQLNSLLNIFFNVNNYNILSGNFIINNQTAYLERNISDKDENVQSTLPEYDTYH